MSVRERNLSWPSECASRGDSRLPVCLSLARKENSRQLFGLRISPLRWQSHVLHDHLIARLRVQEIKTWHVLNRNQQRFALLISELKVVECLLFASKVRIHGG